MQQSLARFRRVVRLSLAIAALLAPSIGTAQSAKLTAGDGAACDYFGEFVAVSGDTAVVGAPFDDICETNDQDQGSAYIFVRTGTVWIEAAKLTASDGAMDDRFGSSVSISGDTVVVGAVLDGDDPVSASGSAYVFVEPVGGWTGNLTETAKLTASNPALGDSLGDSVSISGDTVVAGASGDDDNGMNSGAAYVFVEPGGGWVTMTETAKLTASDGAEHDSFGGGVGIGGDTVVVGARQDDDNGGDSGSAYVFVKPGGGWATMTETAKLTAADGADGDRLGSSVAISGDTVVVGAPRHEICTGNRGSAYVFVEPGGGWGSVPDPQTGTTKFSASDGAGNDGLGASIEISGDTVVAGASGDDIDLNLDQGSAHVFDLPVPAIPSYGLTSDVDAVSHSAGGTQNLDLQPGTCFAGDFFLVLGTMSGSSPGFPVSPFQIPLNFDSYFLTTLAKAPTPLNTLDPAGNGTGKIDIPPGCPLLSTGTTLHHAFLAFDSAAAFPALSFVSNAVPLSLIGP